MPDIDFFKKALKEKKEKVSFNDFQSFCQTTKQYPALDNPLIYPCFGLAGETGEFIEKVKKILRNKKGVFSEEDKLLLALELGDILHYCSLLSSELGFSFEDIAFLNKVKLLQRKKENKILSSGDLR